MSVPVLSDLRRRVRRTLGERTASFWEDAEIDELLVEGIRDLQDDFIPNDALRSLLVTYSAAFNSSEPYIFLPVALGRILSNSLIVVESDTEYGDPWKIVSLEHLRERRRYEMDAAQDVTPTRLFSLAYPVSDGIYSTPVDGYSFAIELYPSPVSGRNYRFSYLAKASESGTMTLPNQDPDLCKLAVDYAIFNAAGKKSRLDAVMVNRHEKRYNDGKATVRRLYYNRYGMSPAQTGTIEVPN